MTLATFRRKRKKGGFSLLGRTTAGRVVRGVGAATLLGGLAAIRHKRTTPSFTGKQPNTGTRKRDPPITAPAYTPELEVRRERKPNPYMGAKNQGLEIISLRGGKAHRTVVSTGVERPYAPILRRKPKASRVLPSRRGTRGPNSSYRKPKTEGSKRTSRKSKYSSASMTTHFAEFRRSRKYRKNLRRRILGRTAAGAYLRSAGLAGALGAGGFAVHRWRSKQKKTLNPRINLNTTNVYTGPDPVNPIYLGLFHQSTGEQFMNVLTMAGVERQILSGRAEFARKRRRGGRRSKKGGIAGRVLGRTAGGRAARIAGLAGAAAAARYGGAAVGGAIRDMKQYGQGTRMQRLGQGLRVGAGNAQNRLMSDLGRARNLFGRKK